jgi:hypothetical protein
MTLDDDTAQKCVGYWRALMLIEPRWEIRLHVAANANEMPTDCTDCEAVIFVHPYWSADLHLNATLIPSDDELDRTIVHELLHVHLKGLELLAGVAHKEEVLDWERERTIEVLTDVIVGLERRYQQAKPRRSGKRVGAR